MSRADPLQGAIATLPITGQPSTQYSDFNRLNCGSAPDRGHSRSMSMSIRSPSDIDSNVPITAMTRVGSTPGGDNIGIGGPVTDQRRSRTSIALPAPAANFLTASRTSSSPHWDSGSYRHSLWSSSVRRWRTPPMPCRTCVHLSSR